MWPYYASAQSYTSMQAASIQLSTCSSRAGGRQGGLGLGPVPAPKSCFPFLVPGVLWTILWVGLMGKLRGDRLTQCYTDPQEGFLAPPTPQLPISMDPGWGLRGCITTSSRCGCSGGHTLRTTSLEARVQLPFWGNCLWCPLKYQGILPQAFVNLKP